MARLKLPIGTSDFEAIRENGCYYVDKTGIIAELIEGNANTAHLFTRPRRFGKSTLLDMLANFFDIRRDSRHLFTGLEIMDHPGIVDSWMNAYPVIRISFKDVDGQSSDKLIGKLRAQIADLYSGYKELEAGDFTPSARKELDSILEGTAGEIGIERSLLELSKALYAHYGKKSIVLIDEYDVPLSKAYASGCYDYVLPIIRSMLSSVLKDNSYVSMAVVTGCLRISKESLFTGLNNLVVHSLASDGYAEYFGFTEAEVKDMLDAAGLPGMASVFRDWYDGYRIGGQEIYCPWDVVNYLNDLGSNLERKPQNYWNASSSNLEIRQFLSSSSMDVSEDFDTLINGGIIEKHISDELTYNDLHADIGNLWSLLFSTGYLTLAEGFDCNSLTRLRIPNQEIRMLFQMTVREWFLSSFRGQPDISGRLYEAIWKADTDAIASILGDIMMDTISYHDYGEEFYHAFLAGLLASDSSCAVRSNRESGLGRYDIAVRNRKDGDIAIFEVKRTDDAGSMASIAARALGQIRERDYAASFSSYRRIIGFGACFCRKSVAVESAILKG